MKDLGLKKLGATWHRLKLRDRLLSRTCFTCEAKSTVALCRKCLKDLERQRPGCRRCGNMETHVDAPTCQWCDRLGSLPDANVSAFVYRNRGRDMYKWVKYQGYWRLLPLICEELPSSWPKVFEAFPNPALVPIPEALNRKWRRQFNPAEQIAKILARDTHWQVQNLLKMRLFQSAMVGLGYEDRRRHARHRFYVRSKKLPNSVILVDDVLTTGATLEAATRVLRKRGVKRIGWFTLFRTL